MRPLRYSLNVTLDGCVDHRSGIPNEGVHRHAAENIARADAMVLGRVTYRMMEVWRQPEDFPAWQQPFARTIDAARKYVASDTLTDVDWNAELLRGDPVAAVRALKSEPGGGLMLGGVRFALVLADAGLIDEYELVVHPVVAGHGPYLFDGLRTPLDLELTASEDLGDGVIARTYVPRT